ncbi:MAG: hypothetical protein PWR10_366 [Halanaerobiales bacterium]|nr:hypothetical protein [Halanaerobiales bacterium]
MIINIRYHIFTITAIFAALGIGILIGSSIVGHEGIVEEQKKIIDNIGFEIKKLKDENLKLKGNLSELELKLASREKIERELLPLVLKNKLGKKEYYFFSENQLDQSFRDKLNSFFRAAGAGISFIDNEQKLKEVAANKTTGLSKLILWNMEEGEKELISRLEEEFGQDKILVYRNSDLLGLILTLLEEELNEGRQEDIGNNSSLQ